MSVVDIVRRASQEHLTWKVGTPARLELDPPLSEAEIVEFEAGLPCHLPDDVRELLRLPRRAGDSVSEPDAGGVLVARLLKCLRG
jgi:hypothetical protein